MLENYEETTTTKKMLEFEKQRLDRLENLKQKNSLIRDFTKLPFVILLEIASYLNHKETHYLTNTCRTFAQLKQTKEFKIKAIEFTAEK